MAVIARRAGTFTAGRIPKKYLLVPVLVGLALGVVALAVVLVFADRALPRVSMAGVDIGGASAADIRSRLNDEVARPWAASRVVVASSDGETWTTTNAALGIAPDLDRAVADALAYGHTGPVGPRVLAWMNAIGGRASVPMAMLSTGGSLNAWVGSIAHAVDRAPTDGAITVTYQGIGVTPAVIGRTMDRTALRAALLGAETLGDRTIDASIRMSYPAVDASGLRDASKARAATTALEVRASDGVVHEDAAGLATLLTVEKAVARPGELDAIPEGAVAPATRYVYRVQLDPARVATWVSGVAKILDRPAKNASYSVRPDGSLAVVAAADGVKIDQAELISDAMAGLVVRTRAPRVLSASFIKDTPVFTTEQAAQLVDKMTVVSSFTTTYPTSAARHANITTGAMQFNDLVLAPGESFSFWDRLGPVSVDRGYAYAGAIINNRSDENVIGGGLCQVSTTLFNAVARAGYDILERHAHGYYIDRYPLGFDAAVFEPGVDFQWKNDTQYPVLLRAYPYAAAIRFDVISVPTGRRVVIGDPVQWDLTDPAPTQPADPAYPPGAVVQGRNVSRSWTVWEGDRIIHDQTFISYYVPVWGGPAR